MSALILGLQTSYEDLSTDPSTVVPVRVSSRPYRDGSDAWLPRIVAGSDPEIRLAISMPWGGGQPSASYGSIDLCNPDGALDSWMEGIWTGRAGDLRVGYADEPWESWRQVAVVRLEHPEYIDGRLLRLTFRDRIEDLERPVQVNFFEAAPNDDLNGQRKPMVIGKPWQQPALLWDEVSATEIYYYVADNAAPALDDGAVAEGLATILKGTGANQYQDWTNGFRLNSQPTLPVTCSFRGPEHQPWPMASSRFTEWEDVGGFELPVDWPELENASAGVRYARRRADTDLLEIVLNNATSGWVRLGQGTVLKPDTTYRLRWLAIDDPGFDNELRLRISLYTAPTGSTANWTPVDAEVDFLNDGPIEFTTPASLNDYYARLRFDRIALGSKLSALFQAIWLEEVDVAAETIDQLVPYLVCERGVVDGAQESGPLSYQDVDHSALIPIRNSLDVYLGHYWQDETTHRQMLDLLFRSMDACWWISRLGKLTAARALLSVDAPVLTFDDSNRTVSIEVARDPAEQLTDSFLRSRNVRPVPEGESAITVSESERQAGAREYRRQARASSGPLADLHPDYQFAIGAAAEETAITNVFGAAADLNRANDRIEEHGQRIWRWRVEGVLTVDEQALLEPKSKVRLISSRLGIAAGVDVEIVDIRLLPVSGRTQIIARG